MSNGQCIVIFRPKFLESDGIFCLGSPPCATKKKMKNIGKTTLETPRGSHDQLESYKPQQTTKQSASLPMIYQ